MRPTIARIVGREILDSRGNPTLEVDCILTNGIMGRASVPSGASTGKTEALELRDKGRRRYLGRGVLRAVANVNGPICRRLKGMDPTDQSRIDQALIELDGTRNKSRLGANALLGVSIAVCRAAAVSAGIPIYRLLGGAGTKLLPVPFLNVINGGIHGGHNLDIQEFMIAPAGLESFSEAIRAGVEVYHRLKELLQEKRLPTTVGDEGGFAPRLRSNEEPLELIIRAIKKAGYLPGRHIYLALDVAASSLYQQGRYRFRLDGSALLTPDELIDRYERWLRRYPIVLIEDGLGEKDWPGWQELTRRLGSKVQLVGDDIFTTNVRLLKRGIRQQVANAVLVKPNQIGTISETLDCIRLATEHGYRTMVSHRSGETDDHFISDLAVATNSGQIKTGAPCRGERTAKYNRLIRIEEEDRLPYAGSKTLKR